MTDTAKPKPQDVVRDWDAIGEEFRASNLSVRDIARKYGFTEAYLRTKASKEGWKRDLSRRITREIRYADTLDRSPVAPVKIVTPAQEEQVVTSVAEATVAISRSHRAATSRARRIVNTLLEQLEAANAHPFDPADVGGLEGRARVVDRLAGSLRSLVDLERRIWSLDQADKDQVPESVDELERRHEALKRRLDELAERTAP